MPISGANTHPSHPYAPPGCLKQQSHHDGTPKPDTQSARLPRRLGGSRATVNAPPSLHEPTERSPGSPRHQFRPTCASGLLMAAVDVYPMYTREERTCRRAGVKVRETNACATCSGCNEDRRDVRGSRGRARFETHDPPAVWLLERSTNMFRHLREEGSASGSNEECRGTPMRQTNSIPLCSGFTSIAFGRYRGTKWFECGLAHLR